MANYSDLPIERSALPLTGALPDRSGNTHHGLDTVSLSFRPSAEELDALRMRMAGDFLLHPDGGGHVAARLRRSAGGAIRIQPLGAGPTWPGGATLGLFDGPGVVFIEGRASALVAGDASVRTLAPPSQLPEVELAARALFQPLAVPLSDHAVLRRADLTSDAAFDDRADGLAFLAALAVAMVPRYKLDAWRDFGRVETVAVRTRGRGAIKARAYDKWVEQGMPERAGELVRMERQERWQGRKCPSIPEFLAMDLAALYARPLLPLIRAARDVVVAGLGASVEAVLEMVSEGRLSYLRAERLIGTLVITARQGADSPAWTDRTAARRRAELRDLGLWVDPLLPEPSVVPVGQILGRLVGAWSDSDLARSA
jgi:hypothetical protein